MVLHQLLQQLYDDVIIWKHFPRYWPFVWGIHRSPIPLSKASDAELCFIWSAPEHTVEQTNEAPLIWYTIGLIMTSLLFQGGSTHYDDVKMSTMASQITSLAIVYSTVYSGADQKHQSSASLAFESFHILGRIFEWNVMISRDPLGSGTRDESSANTFVVIFNCLVIQ